MFFASPSDSFDRQQPHTLSAKDAQNHEYKQPEAQSAAILELRGAFFASSRLLLKCQQLQPVDFVPAEREALCPVLTRKTAQHRLPSP